MIIFTISMSNIVLMNLVKTPMAPVKDSSLFKNKFRKNVEKRVRVH